MAGVFLVSLSGSVWAQGNPLGPEFRVNTYTTGTQYNRSLATGASGDFVVVWRTFVDGLNRVFGQRFAASGAPLGGEFAISPGGVEPEWNPSAAMDASGNFVVVWEAAFDIKGQRFSSSGAPLGPEFRVNGGATPKAITHYPSVAMDSAGNFVVAWHSGGDPRPPPSPADVYAHRFASDGTPVGPEFRVNTYEFGNQEAPSVASDPAGDFVVVWHSAYQDGSFAGVFGQRFHQTGRPAGGEFKVNTTVPGSQAWPQVASDGSGGFVVVWWDLGFPFEKHRVFGQRFASSGGPLGTQFEIDPGTQSNDAPTVAADSAGNFVVAWWGLDGPNYAVKAQRYASSGEPLAPVFRVNTYNGDAGGPRVSADSLGNFVVVWLAADPGDPDWGVFGQRFAQILPVELMDFGVE